MYDFIYNLWFIYNECIWWEWEKNPEIYKNIKGEKQRKKFSVRLPSHPPVWKDGDRLFSGVRKQAGPTVGGTGALV